MNTQPESLGLNMTIAEALEFADEWSKGCTFHAGSQGWRVVCALLAAELRRLQAENEVLKAQRDELVKAAEFAANAIGKQASLVQPFVMLREAIASVKDAA